MKLKGMQSQYADAAYTTVLPKMGTVQASCVYHWSSDLHEKFLSLAYVSHAVGLSLPISQLRLSYPLLLGARQHSGFFLGTARAVVSDVL